MDAHGLKWTRGGPAYFQSSNVVRRGFCRTCGTPLSFELDGWPPNLAIGAFDDPSGIAPALQVGLESKLPCVDRLGDLPVRSAKSQAKLAAHFAAIVSRQHPDHDTVDWPTQP